MKKSDLTLIIAVLIVIITVSIIFAYFAYSLGRSSKEMELKDCIDLSESYRIQRDECYKQTGNLSKTISELQEKLTKCIADRNYYSNQTDYWKNATDSCREIKENDSLSLASVITLMFFGSFSVNLLTIKLSDKWSKRIAVFILSIIIVFVVVFLLNYFGYI